jgi:hypothetical protein
MLYAFLTAKKLPAMQTVSQISKSQANPPFQPEEEHAQILYKIQTNCTFQSK